MSAITPNADDRRHELLCAYLFGELEGEERREIEQALTESEELAAERDRLAATIGVVQSAFPADALSSDVLSDLMRRASTTAPAARLPRGWTFLRGGRGWVRVAAAALILVGGWWGAQWYLDKPPGKGADAPVDAVALLEKSDAEGVRRRAGEAPRAKDSTAGRALGEPLETRDSSEARAARIAGDPGDEDDLQAALEERARGVARGGLDPGLQDQLRKLGYAAGSEEDPAAGGAVHLVEVPTLEVGKKSTGEIEPTTMFFETFDQSVTAGVEFLPAEANPTNLALHLAAKGLAPAPPASAGPSTPGPAGPTAGAGGGSGSVWATPAAPGRAANEARLSETETLSRSFGGLLTETANGEPDASRDLEAREEMLYREALVDSVARYSFGTQPEGEDLGDALGLDLLRIQQRLDNDGAVAGETRLRFEALEDLPGVDKDDANGADGFFLGREMKSTETSTRRVVLTPEEVDTVADVWLEQCRPLAGESPSAMFYRFWGDNAFEPTAIDNQSTFAADVDTASYTLARRYLNDGILPTKQQIRTEEFVNYFDADMPAPIGNAVGDGVFDVYVDMAPSLFQPDPTVEMLRVTVRGKDVDRVDRQPLALTFVVDVSGSMEEGGRLELVKHALGLLVTELDFQDAIALVKFSEEAQVVSPMVSAGHRGPLEDQLALLAADGGTNIEAGLIAGYELASKALTAHAVNRVILLSDGVGNIGETDQERIVATVEAQREKGIYLNTIGVGMGNHNDAFLEQLADKGDGVCNYVDSEREAEKVMVDDFTKTLQPIARDVKIQVEFDPAQVESYRQLGYENRAIADVDFRNDAVDAGEVNAGHQVTALYEVRRLPARADTGIPLARVNLRYKPQRPIDLGVTSAAGFAWAETATEKNVSFFAGQAASSYDATSPGYRRAVLVAQFAEFLRRSVHAEEDSYDVLLAEATRLNTVLDDPDFAEFCLLVEKACPLLEGARAAQPDELFEAVEQLRTRQYELHRDALAIDRALREQADGVDGFRGSTETVDLGMEEQAELTRLEGHVRTLLHTTLLPPPAELEPPTDPVLPEDKKGTVR